MVLRWARAVSLAIRSTGSGASPSGTRLALPPAMSRMPFSVWMRRELRLEIELSRETRYPSCSPRSQVMPDLWPPLTHGSVQPPSASIR
jgi:hypothetical protein